MADAIILTVSPAGAPFVLTASSSPTVNLQLGPSLVGGLDLTGPSSIKGFATFVSSMPQANEIVVASLAPYSYKINIVDSSAVALVAATSQRIFTIKKTVGGVATVIGTITFNAGSANAVINITDPNVDKGNLITIHAPNAQDSTLSDIVFLLAE